MDEVNTLNKIQSAKPCRHSRQIDSSEQQLLLRGFGEEEDEVFELIQ